MSGPPPRRRSLAPTPRSPRRRLRLGAYRAAAARRLARFRRGSALAVGFTALLLLLAGAPDVADGSAESARRPDSTGTARVELLQGADEAVEEATSTLRELASTVYAYLPKLAVAIVVLLAAAGLTALLRPLLRRMLGSWRRGNATGAGVAILIWILAIGTAFAVITGDVRTILGSVGLLGLALSWALQAPIESFTAWVLNSFREYYRVGDRIAVGDVFGDVHRIDFLTTTVWETGRPDANGLGGGATGGLITFPNSEVLRANIVNYTRDFAWVWDEVTTGVANESDLRYAMQQARDVAERVVGQEMKEPAATYRSLLARAGLDADVADSPQVFLSTGDAWTNVSIRYLVPARRKRDAASRLLLALSEEFRRDEHKGRILGAYPYTRIQMMDRE